MKIIGITGPTGAGKTTALGVLKEMGVCIIDADTIYHSLLESETDLNDALCDRYGDILAEDGSVDRKRLGEIVFRDDAALTDLNVITHRYMCKVIRLRLTQAECEHYAVAAIDAIALLESGLGADCAATVAVLAPAEVRVRRIMAREGISEEYARKRVSAQREDNFFRANCTYVLENSAEDTPEDFAGRARILFEQILNL